MGFDNWMLALDETLTHVLGQWDIYTTSIASLLLAFFAYQVFTRRDPDTHPMLLARQSQPSPVRQPGQSPVYRNHASPYGMELNAGLNVRDAGVSKWAKGRNGDLRDIWRRVASGSVDKDGNVTGEKGSIITTFGVEKTIEHALDDLSTQINIIGQHIKKQNGSRVAVYLPNSIELLMTLFACAFYDLTPILLPYDQKPDTIVSQLKSSKADVLVAAVGSIALGSIVKQDSTLHELIWVTDSGSKHMNWNEQSSSIGSIRANTWQEIVNNAKAVTSDLPETTKGHIPPGLVTFWQKNAQDAGSLVEYSQANLVAGIAAQLTSIPISRRITPADLIFPADSLANVYTLLVTLTAIYYNSSLVLSSVANADVDLVVATKGIAPTLLVASPESLKKVIDDTTAKLSSPISKLIHWFQTRSLAQDGVMPLASFLTSFSDSKRPVIGTTPGKLRLIFTAEKAGASAAPLSSIDLSNIRIYTGARVIYALTAAGVAGSVAQTGFYDYRVDNASTEKHSHFGAPVTSLEIYFKDSGNKKTTDLLSTGEIVARGPSAVGGEVALGITGLVREDLTLAYA